MTAEAQARGDAQSSADACVTLSEVVLASLS